MHINTCALPKTIFFLENFSPLAYIVPAVPTSREGESYRKWARTGNWNEGGNKYKYAQYCRTTYTMKNEKPAHSIWVYSSFGCMDFFWRLGMTWYDRHSRYQHATFWPSSWQKAFLIAIQLCHGMTCHGVSDVSFHFTPIGTALSNTKGTMIIFINLYNMQKIQRNLREIKLLMRVISFQTHIRINYCLKKFKGWM